MINLELIFDNFLFIRKLILEFFFEVVRLFGLVGRGGFGFSKILR